MITVSDVGNIVYRHALGLGYETWQAGNIPVGKVTEPRVTVATKSLSPEKFWKKTFVELNLIAPDIEDEKDKVTLDNMDREANACFEKIVDTYDGTVYRITIAGETPMEDKSIYCHYINIRLLFEILNTR